MARCAAVDGIHKQPYKLSTMSSTLNTQMPDSDSEISLLDIVNFLADSWKKLVAAALAGALLGLGFWFLVASY